MKLRNILFLLMACVIVTVLPSCIEDGFTTSSSDQPTFSADTLKMGEIFTQEGTPTKRFTVYNHADKNLSISSITLRDDADAWFRLNVDGISGRSFSNVEIRPNDSIFVFVEATVPANGVPEVVSLNRHLDFVTNGQTRTVVLNAQSRDVIRLRDVTLTESTTLTAREPYVIYGSLRVPQGITLTLEPGATIHLHDKARIDVEGSLISSGTPQANVNLIGERTGNVAASIPYELMSGQWDGIYFAPTSTDNRLEYTSVRNSSNGLTFEPNDAPTVAEIINCQIRNTTNYIINAAHANLRLTGCELTDASLGILHLKGGHHEINHCTIANYYLFTALGGPAIQFEHIDAETADDSGKPMLTAEITNTIIYGNGTELSHGTLDDTGVYLRRCLLRSAGSDDDHFINCIWDEDPLYYTIRNEYIFDYRLKPESPAIGAADPALDTFGLTEDRYGQQLNSPADLGAYVFAEPTDNNK